MNKIKNKILLALILVTLIPAILIGAYSLYSTSSVLRENVLAAHVNKIDLIQVRIENLLKEVDSDLLYLREINSLNLFLQTTEESGSRTERLLLTNLRSSFQKFAGQKKIYHKVRFIDTDGQEVVSVQQVDGQPKIISDTHLQNEAKAAFFDDTLDLAKGDFRISSLQLDRENGEIVKPVQPTLQYSSPVYDRENRLRGIVVLNVDANKIMQIIQAESEDGEQLLFTNPDGFYYYTPESDKTWGSELDLNTGHNLFSDIPDLREKLDAENRLGYIETANNIMVYNPIAVSSKNHLLGNLYSIQSKSALFKPLKDYLKIFAAIALGSLLLAFALAANISNSITRPLIALKNSVENLSAGDVETTIDVKSKDEVGDLAHAIELLRKSMKILMRRSR